MTTAPGPDGRPRCAWCSATPDYTHYHDTEWGFPVADDRRLFEKLCLEGFQSGLSWRTILTKRENFRAAFAGFDIDRVAAFTEADVTRLLSDAGIVRHRGKIEGTIASARAYLEIEAEQGFSPFLWSFVGDAPLDNHPASIAQVPASTPQSEAMSRALKAQGFSFVGPTISYAFMQAAGLVNDHLASCPAR